MLKAALQRIVLIVTVMYLAGGHWGVLQVIAWGKMAIDYTAEKGLAQGLEETFDAEHGCQMCKRIWEEHEKEKQNQSGVTQIEQWIKIFPISDWHVVIPVRAFTEVPKAQFAGPYALKSQWSSAPEAPPPRQAEA